MLTEVYTRPVELSFVSVPPLQPDLCAGWCFFGNTVINNGACPGKGCNWQLGRRKIDRKGKIAGYQMGWRTQGGGCYCRSKEVGLLVCIFLHLISLLILKYVWERSPNIDDRLIWSVAQDHSLNFFGPLFAPTEKSRTIPYYFSKATLRV